MKFIFDVIVHSFSNKRIHFLEIFLRHNKSYEDFEKLRFEPSSFSSGGSFIPVFEAKIKYLESVKELLTGSDFLRHKIRVNNEILSLKQMIVSEGKQEFIDGSNS